MTEWERLSCGLATLRLRLNEDRSEVPSSGKPAAPNPVRRVEAKGSRWRDAAKRRAMVAKVVPTVEMACTVRHPCFNVLLHPARCGIDSSGTGFDGRLSIALDQER